MKMHERTRHRLALCITGMTGIAGTWVAPSDSLAIATTQPVRSFSLNFTKIEWEASSPHSGGVNVAAGDVDGDDVDELILSPNGQDPPEVQIVKFDKSTPLLAKALDDFDPPGQRSGVRVAAGDLDGDGRAEILATHADGPEVQMWKLGVDGGGSGTPSELVVSDKSSPNLDLMPVKHGVRVAVGDVDGDSAPEIITSAVPAGGDGAVVRAWDFFWKIEMDYQLAPEYNGGVRVAAGDVTGDGIRDIIVGADTMGQQHLYGIQKDKGASRLSLDMDLAAGEDFAVADLDDDGLLDLVVGSAPGAPSLVRKYEWAWSDGGMTTGMFVFSDMIDPYPDFPGVLNGVHVALADFDGDRLTDSIITAPATPEPGTLTGAAIAGALLIRTRRRRC